MRSISRAPAWGACRGDGVEQTLSRYRRLDGCYCLQIRDHADEVSEDLLAIVGAWNKASIS